MTVLFVLAALAQAAMIYVVLSRRARRTEWEPGAFAGLVDDLMALDAQAPLQRAPAPPRRSRGFAAAPGRRHARSAPRRWPTLAIGTAG